MSVDKPHDTFFRTLREDIEWADALIRQHLPDDLAAHLPDARFSVLDSKLIGGNLGTGLSDGVFFIHLKDKRVLYVVLEHKSYVDYKTPKQIQRYVSLIWEAHNFREGGRRPMIIMSIVVYHGKKRWTVPRSITDVIQSPSGDPFRYELLDLTRTPYRELSEHDFVRGGLALLKYARTKEPPLEDLREAVLTVSARGTMLKETVAEYMLTTLELPPETIRRLLDEADPNLWEKVMPSLAETWKMEGKAEGIVEGKAEGIVEGMVKGEAKTLLRQLERRFGAVSEDIRGRVLAAPLEDLDAWLDAVVSVSSLDDVFSNGAIH